MKSNSTASMAHGWLLPTLLENDDRHWGRWRYWNDCVTKGIPDGPIPEVWLPRVSSNSAEKVRQMLGQSLDAISDNRNGAWRGWSGPEYIAFFVDWLLWSFGYGSPTPPGEPVKGAATRLQDTFQLDLWQERPGDYLGDLISECAYGTSLGFYPTPRDVTPLMMNLIHRNESFDKTQRSSDDACGTGALLLEAGNYCLSLHGIELNPFLIRITLLNGFIACPWLAKSIPQLDNRHRLFCGNTITLQNLVPVDELTRPSDRILLHYQAKREQGLDWLVNDLVTGMNTAIASRMLEGKGDPTSEEIAYAKNYGSTFNANFPILMGYQPGDRAKVLWELSQVLAVLKLSENRDLALMILFGWLTKTQTQLSKRDVTRLDVFY